MSILSRITNFLGMRNVARNPIQHKPRHSRKKKAPIKGGRFARTIIRSWNRQHKTYVPGQLGLSSVSSWILNHYDGQILSRRERKRIAKKTQQPRPVFYSSN